MFADTNNLDQPPDNTVDMPPIPNRAALYLGPGDADEDARERALRRYVGTVGLAVVAVYRDTGEESLARLVEDARADLFDAVVVADRADIASGATGDETGDDGGRLRDLLTEVSVRLIVADETSL